MENYQFIKQIGHGSFSEIWLVKCSKTRKKHVLKRIDLNQASKREQRAAHLEAKLLSTIKHPNIVTYLDCFHNSFGSLFIVMSYFECGDLYTFIRNQNGVHFDEKQIVHWFVQICLALKYLHDKNILHRNLKTKNIFLTKNKIIKVGDLGISKILSITYEMTSTSIEAPCYISPEIFAGELHTEKSDVWALGCCAYEMAALKSLYVIQDIHSAMQRILKRKLSPIPEMYSVELYEIIYSMLDLKSENRPSITQLLLNDYVRRYILLILQDNSKSPDSQHSENSSVSSIERSKSNFDLSLAASKNPSSGSQRSMSTCFLSRNISKGLKAPSFFTKDQASKSVITTIPDVNGNGDGNDNSQRGRNAHAHQKVEQKSNKVICEKNKNSSENEDDIKNAVKLQLNGISNAENFLPTNLKNFEMDAKKQKLRGEISFQLLNSLAYSLYTVRPENFDNISLSSNGHSKSESLLIKPHQSYSFVDDHAEKQLIKKNVKTIRSEKNIAKGHYQNNVCSLPEIKCELKNDKVNKSNEDNHNLPHVKLSNSK